MYNPFPIKNYDLIDNTLYSQLDASGIVVTKSIQSVAITSTGINQTNGNQSFIYKSVNILSSTTVPIPTLPYQEYLLLNKTSSPITYTLPTSYIIYYNGNSYTSVTLRKIGENITLASFGGNIYYVVQTSGTVNNANIDFN
jgi:hypothetical protein